MKQILSAESKQFHSFIEIVEQFTHAVNAA